MCTQGTLSSIILTDNRIAKIDTRILSNEPEATQQNGLNLVLNNAAKNAARYPMIQARVRDVDGGTAILTIVANPTTREGGLLISNMAGTVINADLLKGGEKDGQKLGAQYTPVALSTLDKMHTADVEPTTTPALNRN